MREIYVGFHAPYFAKDGRPHPQGWFGHCEAWGYEDETWTFIDPQAKGLMVRSFFRYEDVQAQLAARFAICRSILRIAAQDRPFRRPALGPMTCAGVCGALVGIRALGPSALHRKLLALGAEAIHDTQAKSDSDGRGNSGARA